MAQKQSPSTPPSSPSPLSGFSAMTAAFASVLNPAWTRWTLPVLALTVLGFSALSSSTAESWYSRAAYYLIWLLVIIWGTAFAGMGIAERWDARAWFQKNRVNLLLAGALTALIGLSVPATLRVLSDEANVIAVSRSMAQEKRADNVTHGFQYYFNFHAEDSARGGIEKHALLYPFATHLVHAVSGYRVENAYAANLILLFLTLVLIHHLLAPLAGPYGAAAGQLLAAATPIVTLVARSAGVDLIAALCLLLVLWAILLTVKSPTRERQVFLITTLALWANARQEAPLAALGVLAILTLTRRIDWARAAWDSLRVRLLCFALLPILWQRMLVKDPFENSPSEVPFSLTHLADNNFKFLKLFVNFDFVTPFNAPVLWLGAAGIIGIGWIAWRGRRGDGSQTAWTSLAMAAAVGIPWLVLTAYFRGIPDHPTNARYFAPFCVLLAMAAAWMLRRLFAGRGGELSTVAAALLLFVLYHPVAAEGRFTNGQLAVREYRFAIKYLQNYAPLNSLIISARPGHFAIHEYGSVSFAFANQNQKTLLENLHNHLFATIYAIQEIDPKTQAPLPGDRLGQGFVLEPVAMIQSAPDEIVRISEIIRESVDWPGTDPDASGSEGTSEPLRKVISNIPGVEGEIGIVDPSDLRS